MNFEARYYENTELWAIENISAADRQRIETMADKIPIDARTLIDVGCGNGLFLEHLNSMQERRFERLCGTDRSMAALACVQAEKVLASVELLPFLEHEFDIVSCMEVLEHLPQKTYISSLDEISRIARRYILISVPYNEDLRMSLTECTKCCCRFNPNYHLRIFNESTMRHLFDDEGFMCREIFYMYSQKVVPAYIEVTLRFFGILKRKILHQSRPPMADRAVCPACGYSPRTDSHEPSTMIVSPVSKVGKVIRSILCIGSKWRWMGALYERMR